MRSAGIFLIFLLGCMVSQGQQYYPFIEEGKTCAELNVFQPGYPDPPYISFDTHTFKFEGDTLFEGNTWKKLFLTTSDPVAENWQQDLCFYRPAMKSTWLIYSLL